MKNETNNEPLSQVMEYWQTARQNKWGIFFLTLGLTLVAVMGIAVMPDTYQATTTILVDPQKVSDQYVNPAVHDALTDRLQTITQEVLSSTRLQELIDRYQLYPEDRRAKSPEQTIAQMRKAITIEVKHAAGNGPGAFTITYEGRNPVIVAQVTNELASRFIEWNLQSREQLTEVTAQFLDEQLQEAKKKLETQENQVREFAMSHLGEMPDNLPANLGTLAQLRATYQADSDSLDRLEQQRLELLRMPQPVQDATGHNIDPASSERGRLEAEEIRLQEQLLDLRRRYTPAHPEVVETAARLQRVKEEIKQLPPPVPGKIDTTNMTASQVRLEIISHEMSRLTEDMKKVQEQMVAYQSKVDAMPLREQQLTDLTRDYEISKQEYSTLLGKKYSADMATNLERKQQGERFTVIDPAIPPGRPIRPNRALLMLAALFGSLFLSIALVIGREKLDMTVRAEQDLEDLLPAPVTMLALIPTIDTPGDRQRRRRFAIFALATALFACMLVAGFLWRVHPIL